MNDQNSDKNSITDKLTTFYQIADANIEQWFQNFIKELENYQREYQKNENYREKSQSS